MLFSSYAQSKEPESVHLQLRKEECPRRRELDDLDTKDTSFAGMLRSLAAGSNSASIARSMGAQAESSAQEYQLNYDHMG